MSRENEIIDEITKELALKNGYSLSKAKRLTNSIFKAIKDTMETNKEPKTISIMNIGKLKPSKLAKNIKKKKERELNELSKECKTDSTGLWKPDNGLGEGNSI